MSKLRKSIKLTIRYFHCSGTAMRANICPAASSITTTEGSGDPAARATDVAAHTPRTLMRATASSATIHWLFGVKYRANTHHNSRVAPEAQVPGPGCICPNPPHVAISHAIRLACPGCALLGALVAFTWSGRISLAAGLNGV